MEKSQTFDDEVFYSGSYEHSLDAQSRLTIPSDWRNAGDTRLIMLPGRANDLLLYPFATFREFLQKAGRLSLANRELQEALARIGERARDCRCDKQGRIKIDKAMLDSIGVKSQLKMIGCLTHIKLCAVENWNHSDSASDDTYFDELKKITDSVIGSNGGL